MRMRARRAAPRPPGRCLAHPATPGAAPLSSTQTTRPAVTAAAPPTPQHQAQPPPLPHRPCLAALLLLSLLLPGGLAATAATARASATASYALPCERSGYCSLGQTKPYVGEVDSSLGLRAALAARSYRREVILMSSDSERMMPAMMAVQNLLRLGLEHVMMMSSSGPDCVRVAGAVPTAGCVWLDFELPVFGADREFVVPAIPMWHNRYRLAARVVRLGYNVFLTDTDVIFFDDPYVYFKSPPFANYTVINQPETLYDQADYAVESEPNGGVLYVQGAAPGGPAAWMLAEVTDRLLRWVEDGFNTTRHTHSILTWCNYMDQDGLRDAISSVMLGRVFFGVSLKDCRSEEWKEKNSAEHQAIVDAIDDQLRDAPGGGWRTAHAVPLPPVMQPVAGADSADLRLFTMHLPVYQPWDAKWGPWLYPPRRGPLSSAWLAQLRDDCGGCPLWPDPEDPASASSSSSSAAPTESYLLAPPFLLLNWFARGRLGYWSRALGGPQQVAGHLHYIPGTDAALGKTVARMAVGHYDWGLARQVLGPRMYFMHQGSSATPQPYHEGQPGGHVPLQLLALHPALAARLAATNTWTEYSALLGGLMTVAHALKRIPVWPDPPCAAPWVSEDGPQGAATLPLGIRMEFIPYGRRRSSMSCVWLPLLNGGCLLGGRGMLALEFAHWKTQVRMQFAVEPGPHNTIGHLSAAAAADPAFAPAANATPTARIYNVAMDEVARAWGPRRTHNQRVLYLRHPLNVTFPPVTEDTYSLMDALADCKATNPQDVYQDLEDKPYHVVRKPHIAFTPAALDAAGALVPSPAIPGYNVPAPRPGAEGAEAAGVAGGGGVVVSGGAGGAAGNATVVEEVVEDDGRPFHTDKGSAASLAATDAAGAAAIAAASAAAAAGGTAAAAEAAGAAGAAAAAAVSEATTTTASALDVASAAAVAAAAAAEAAAAIANQAVAGGAAATAAGADGAAAAAATTIKKKKKKKKKTLLPTAGGAVNGTDASALAAGAAAAQQGGQNASALATTTTTTTAAADAAAAALAGLQAAAAGQAADAAAAAGTVTGGSGAAAAATAGAGAAGAAAGVVDAATGAAMVTSTVPRTTIAVTAEAATVAAGSGAVADAAGSGAADTGADATTAAGAAGTSSTDAAATTATAAGTAVDGVAAAADGAAAAVAGAANTGAAVDAGATAGAAGVAAGATTATTTAAAATVTDIGSAATDAATAAGTAADAAATTTEAVDADTITATGAAAEAAAAVSPSPSPADPGVIASVDGQRVAGVHVVTAAELAAAAANGPEAEAVRANALSAVQGMGPFGMAAALKAEAAAAAAVAAGAAAAGGADGGGGAHGGRGTRAGMGGGQGLASARGGSAGGGGGAAGFQRGGMTTGNRGQFRGGGGGGMGGGSQLRQRVMGGGGGMVAGGGGVMGGGGMGGGIAAAADAEAMAIQSKLANTHTGTAGAAAGAARAGGGGGGTTRVAGAGGAGAGVHTRSQGAGGGAVGSAAGGGGTHVVNRAQLNKLQEVMGGRGGAAHSDLARFQAAVAAAQGRAGLTGGGVGGGGGGGGIRMARGGTRWLLDAGEGEGEEEEEEHGEEEVEMGEEAERTVAK